MFSDIGGKLKMVAKVICWVGIIASCIAAIAMMVEDEDLIFGGLIVAVVGSLVSWGSSLAMYGFGELIDIQYAVNKNAFEIYKLIYAGTPKEPVKAQPSAPAMTSATTSVNATENGWYCRKCSTKNSPSAVYCKDCGEHR